MPITSNFSATRQFYDGRRIRQALTIGANDPEDEQLRALDVLTGGNASALLDDKADGRSLQQMLADYQTAIRTQDITKTWTPEKQEWAAHEGDAEWRLKRAQENAHSKTLGQAFAGWLDEWKVDEQQFRRASHQDWMTFARYRDNYKRWERKKDAFNQHRAKAAREWLQQFTERLNNQALVEQYEREMDARNLMHVLPALKDGLTETGRSIVDSAVANGMKWDDSRWKDFRSLEQEEQERVSSVILMLTQEKDVSAWGAFWRKAGNMAKEVWWDSPADTVASMTRAWFTDRSYQEEVTSRARRRQMLQDKFKDFGTLGNAFADSGGILGYGTAFLPAGLLARGSGLAARVSAGAGKAAQVANEAGFVARDVALAANAQRAAQVASGLATAAQVLPKVGTALYAIDNQNQYLQRIALDGGDVTNPVTQMAAWSFGVASAMVENIQWEQFGGLRGLEKAQIDAYSKCVHGLFGRLAERYGIHDIAHLSVGRALGTVLLERIQATGFEAFEEAIQQTMEEVVVSIGVNHEVRLADAIGAGIDAFTQSLGPMAITMIAGIPARGASAALNPAFDVNQQEKIYSAAERVVKWLKNGEWDKNWNTDKEKKDAIRSMSVMFSRWASAENDADALHILQRMGMGKDTAIRFDAIFRSIRQDVYVQAQESGENPDALLPKGIRAENPIDVMAEAAGGKMGKDMGVSADGKTLWRNITIGGKTIRLNTRVERLASDMADEDLTQISRQRARSFVQSMLTTSDKGVQLAMQASGLDGKTADEIVADAGLLAKAQAIKTTLDLRDIGGTQTAGVRRGADGQVTEVNVDVTLDPSAFRGTVRHESVHVIEEVLKAVGISPENAKKLARSAVRSAHLTERQNRQLARNGATMAPKGENEKWNEEMAPIVAELMRTESEGPLVDAAKWAWETAKGLLGLQKRQQASRTAVDFFVNAMRTGHIEDLDSLTFEESASDAILREVAESGPKADETAAQDAAEEARQDAAPPNAGEPPAPQTGTGKGPSSGDQAPADGDQAPAETAPETPTTSIDPSEVARKIMAHDAVTLDEMAALKKAAPDLTTGMAWARGYVFNPATGMWAYNADLEGKRDERDAPQRPYVGIDGQQHDPAAERAKGDESDLVGHDALEARQEADDFFEEEMDAAADAIRQIQEQGLGEADAILQYIKSSGPSLHPRVAAELRSRLPDARMQDEADRAMEKRGGEKHFMLRSFADGTQFVEIEDVPAEIRNETDTDKLRAMVAQLIRKRWMNQIIDPQGVRVFVNGRTAQEYAYPAKDIDGVILRAKMDAAGKLDEVVSTSAHPRAVPDGKDGHVHPNVKEWEHRDAIFHVNERYYGAIVNIAIVEKVGGATGNFRLLKDVTQIKDITDEVRNLHGDPIEGSQSYPSTVGDNASQTPSAPDVNSENPGRHQVSPRLPSPEFAMDGTVADALPAHLREDARAIIAERANTPAWMVEPDGTPTDLNERDWLRREAEKRHEAGRRFAIPGLYTGSAADYAQRDEDGNIVNGPSLHYVGTGEKTAVFGYGLYASARRGIAEAYRSKVFHAATDEYERKHGNDAAYPYAVFIDGKEANWDVTRTGIWSNSNGKDIAIHTLAETGSIGEAIAVLRQKYQRERQYIGFDMYPEKRLEAIEWLKNNREHLKCEPLRPLPYLYEQTFFTNRATPEETERHLLKWYETVPEEQLDWVAKQWKKEKLNSGAYTTRGTPKKGLPPWLMDDWRAINHHTGEELYKRLQYYFESAKAASDFLARAGIDGVKMPVYGFQTGGASDGNVSGWNYVSFRDDNIRVDHKWVDGERRYQIAGRAGAERLGIRGLGDAEAMERSGATREEIWRETGWWRGKDGEWRVEVPDITPTPASFRVFDGGYGAPLSELVHVPELMAAYPELADIPVFLNSVMGAAGQLTERNGRPVIELNAGKALEFFTFKNGTHVLNEYGVRILSHEIQHAIQLQEGFARGASPEYWQRQLDAGYDARPEVIKAEENRLFEQYEKERAANPDLFTAMEALDAFTPSVPRGKFDPDTLEQLEEDPPEWKRFDKRRDELEERYGKAAVFRWFYLREKLRVIAKAKGEDAYGLYRQTAGEVESRNVEKRLKMTPEERAATPPWETEDVEEGRQIVRHEVASNIAAILSRFEEAKGKSKQEIFAQFDNTQKVIGALPDDLELPPRLDVKERVVKGAEAYILNHILNEAGHETQYTAEDARRVLGLIDPANEMRVVEQRGSLSLAFIAENPNGGWDCIVIAPKRGEFFIFKTMFGQKRKPYQGKTRIRYSVAPVRRGEAANPLIRGGLTSIRDFSGATPGSQAHPGGDVNWEGVGRGSVAGSDPGWFDLAGQLGAAEREARETARHGLAFGGARFSNRSWVEAFAARDKALKIERSDEDYERLIAALGLAGKMTAADARESAEALQREVKGGAGVIADLVKAAEKKNFRQTVEKIVTAAHGYGIEVGANAYQAWERFLSEMRRTAKGRDAADFTNDTGWDLAELLWAANEAGFELQRKGKPAAEEGAPQEAGGATDEETELEAALIDGREGDLGLTAAEARERLRKLAEERMGDVEGRRSRLRAALEAWRKSEVARIEKLRAEREAKEAAKATAEADATAGMDDRADAEGKHKGERPEEENEDEAVEETPDFKAFCERLKAEGLDLENPGEVAYVMRWYVEDWMAKKSGKAPGEVLKDPVAAAQYRRTVVQLLRDAANKLLAPNDGMAAKTVERMIGEIPGDATANEIQSRSRSIIGFIKRNAIRQSRKQLVKGIQDDIQKQGIKGKKFDETEKDIGRKITGEREAYCRYLKRILNWGSRRIAAEQQRLNDIITGRLDAYKAARGEDAALEALAITDREIHRATERLNALQLWGGLRAKSPGEIGRAGQQIHEWLEKERDEHEKRWSKWMARNDEMAARFAQAVSASMGDYTPDDPGAVGQLVDLLTTNFRSRLERLAVGSGAEGRRAIDEVMMLVYAGSERLGVLKAQRRQRTDAMLARCVEGTGQTVGEFRKSLDEAIPEELNRVLATEEQPTRMTWGQALQLLGSLEQTASYKRNIDENGRGAVGLDGEEQTPHRDLILQALADKPQMLRLVEEMRKIYDEDREAISREFFAVTGNAVLTPDPLYLPARMFTGARENLETTVRAWNPFGPAFTPRIANKRDFDLSASIMDVYNERMKETATALAFGMRGMELRSVLARKSVQEAIARTHGKFALRKMIAQLTDIVSDGYKGDGGQLEGYRKAIRAVGDLTTYSALSWNVVTMLKQMTSIPAWTALLDGGYGEIFRHIVHFDAAAAKELMAAPGFTARYGAQSFARMFRQELENPQGGNVLARLYKAGMTAVQMGDFVPGILVGSGVYKARKLALMRRGMQEGAAREQAARETWGLIEENQQSSRLENTPEILRRGGFIGRQLSKFASSPMMQVGHEVHTLRMWMAEARLEARHGGKESGAVKAMLNAKGDDAKRWRKRFVNQFICNHVLMPGAMYAIATLFKAALGGEPPDKDEVFGDLVMQMVAGPWSRIFLLGAVADTTGEWAARLLGGKPNVYSRSDLAATQHLHKAMSNAGRLLGDAMDADWASCRDDFVKMVSSYNAPFRYAATAVQNATGYDPVQARRRRKREIAKREAAE